MKSYKAPDVYMGEDLNSLPSIASVETAIPSFIGYTEIAQWQEKEDLKNVPLRITSMLEYEQYFGYPDPESKSLSVVLEANGELNASVDETKRSKFLMHYSMQLYFANGGGTCWVTSVGNYVNTEGQVEIQDLKVGLTAVAKINEVTLLVFPDSINLRTKEEYYDLHTQAILQCVFLQDRFTVMDVYHTTGNLWSDDMSDLRAGLTLSTHELKYAAAYFPKLYTNIDFHYKQTGDPAKDDAITKLPMLMPISAAIVGVYAQIDQNQGVWKAPANINIAKGIRPEFLITQDQQERLNVDTEAGKSINVIRSFAGRGPAVIWSARTLAGNDIEWRYISVRRFFNMVAESVKNATEQFVFEANDRNTWIKVRSMVENYLLQLWRVGALVGASTNNAFFVHVGIGQTMTARDIQEGRMIIQIGMAVVRQSEFTILRIAHNMSKSSKGFPIKLVHTGFSWKDLAINNQLKKQFNELKNSLKNSNQSGYRTIFSGPSTNSKIVIAELLGREAGKRVCMIDLSKVISKYIGETEKNLEHLFARAEEKSWILYFDEADALFGKRTNVQDAHDRYANQEITYLLQHIEKYNGIVIIATQMKKNIDQSFTRRFNFTLNFRQPDTILLTRKRVFT